MVLILMPSPKVFISYSHDSDEHRAAILGLAQRMRNPDGIEVTVDRYVPGTPNEGWPRWMRDQIEQADYVLVVCTPTYYQRFVGHEVPGKGKGADWEGILIMQALYDRQIAAPKFVPVLLDAAHENSIPEPLRPATRYVLTSLVEYQKLCQFLRGEAGVLPSSVATLPPLVRVEGKPIQFEDELSIHSSRTAERAVLPRSGQLWGREALLGTLIPTLQQSGQLVLFGMRGIGKSRVIESIARAEPWIDWGLPLRIFAGATAHHADVFRTIAQSLGISDENPRPPTGSVAEIIAALAPRIEGARSTFVWVDQAHCWFVRGQWANPELERLVTALLRLTSEKWNWIFEFREHPPETLRQHAIEVPGLDKQALAKWFEAVAPDEQRQEWILAGDRLKAMYQWLGGGHGQQAHPLATSLLIEVALGTHSTPLQVRQRLVSEPAQQVENLLSDLFNNVLSESERKLLLAIGLYRGWIPHDHLAWLEAGLPAEGAWLGLDQRCLLPSDDHQERYYLHGFVSDWLRRKFAYPVDQSERIVTARGPASDPVAREIHELIADCWLWQLQRNQHRSALNTERALEAFHHLIAADRSNRLGEITPGLIAGREEGALDRLWILCDSIHANQRSRKELEVVLRVILDLDPGSHKAFRFLGETLQRLRGAGDAEATNCFRRAIELRPGFAPYLCNLGVALKATGLLGATEFVATVAQARRRFPTAVNDQVVAVELLCLAEVDPNSDEPSRRRRERIAAGSRHEAFFTDEAEWQLKRRPPAPVDALRVLDTAIERGCHGDFSLATRARALDVMGRHQDAHAIRSDLIRQGTGSAAVYHGEAMSLLNQRPPDPLRALAILDMANRAGCSDEYTTSIRATALELGGKGEEASNLRQREIENGTRGEVFFTAEADWQLAKKPPNTVEAMRILALAKSRDCATEHTASVEAKTLEALGHPEEASALRRSWIDAGSTSEVLYTAEAHWQLRKHPPDANEALRILDAAAERGCADEYSASVRATALEELGRHSDASELRRSFIRRGSRSAAIYNAEAEWLLSQNPPQADAAMELLKVPLSEGFSDQFTGWTLSKAKRFLEDGNGKD